MEHHGFILIADITGYTIYLNESELDHARCTPASLLEPLIEQTKPPLVVSGLEGDSVFGYGLGDEFVEAQTLLEMIERTYISFRRAIELMVLNNTCECNACAHASSLDLKFLLHYGTFALEAIGSGQELIGRDVNLAHRLLKNSVTEDHLQGHGQHLDGAILPEPLIKRNLERFRKAIERDASDRFDTNSTGGFRSAEESSEISTESLHSE